jgi:hypothetical protein
MKKTVYNTIDEYFLTLCRKVKFRWILPNQMFLYRIVSLRSCSVFMRCVKCSVSIYVVFIIGANFQSLYDLNCAPRLLFSLYVVFINWPKVQVSIYMALIKHRTPQVQSLHDVNHVQFLHDVNYLALFAVST